MSNWDIQSDGVQVSGNYLEHTNTRRGYSQTNAERFGLDPLTERTDFLIQEQNGGHSHFSVDASGNITKWH